MSTETKIALIHKLDNIITICLFLYTLTFLSDIKINFLTTAAAFGIIKLFFVRPQIQINTKLFYLIAIFLFFTFIPIFLNDAASFTSYNLTEYKSRFISPLIGMLIIFLFEFTKKRITILLSGFALTLFANAVYLIYQVISSSTILFRPVGFASTYMLLGAVFLLILPIIFTLALSKTKLNPKLRLFFALTIFVNIPAVILANTRIAYIGIAVSFIISIFIGLKNKKQSLSLLIVLSLYAFTIFHFAPTSGERLESISDTSYENQSNSERILMWQSAIKMFEDHPIFGVGVGNYHDQYMNKYRSPLSRENSWHPHNSFLTMLSESGIFGALSFLALFIYLYYSVIKNFFKTKNPYYLAYLSCLIAYSINLLTDSMFCGHYLKSPTTIFWLFTGIYLILNKQISYIQNYNDK